MSKSSRHRKFESFPVNREIKAFKAQAMAWVNGREIKAFRAQAMAWTNGRVIDRYQPMVTVKNTRHVMY